MGYERFKSADYESHRSINNYQTKSRDQIFTSRHMPRELNPALITLRESCDSDANPNSTPIMFGLDVTGSMGFVAEAIAKEELGPMMESIYNDLPITDPHIMFMGVGDLNARDEAPLQVSQFEAGAVPLLKQLSTIFLEGGGGGNSYESYDLPWYFAAHRTAIDSVKNRGQKGFLFTIGDEPPPPARGLDFERLATRVFNNRDIPQPGTRAELLETVREKYKVFHIVAEQGSYFCHSPSTVKTQWNELLGPNVIYMKNLKDLSLIVTATLKIAQGADIFEVINSSNKPDVLRHAFQNALVQAG